MGPLHQQMLLLMASIWPIIFWEVLPMHSLGPIRFLGGTPDAFRWAHCIGRCCCQLLHFGPLYFWKMLPMHLDGPIALADAAANGFALAHYFSLRRCRYT